MRRKNPEVPVEYKATNFDFGNTIVSSSPLVESLNDMADKGVVDIF
ncbi:hypothetical protein [Veronia pacifica]|nr:hypothetical protein [Veronia pacifica]